MIDLHYQHTPNGHKITIFLAETELPYTIRPLGTAGPTGRDEASRRILFGQDRSTVN
jgi:glutathione S-transferase